MDPATNLCDWDSLSVLIFRHLDASDLCRASCVSRSWFRAANAEPVWRDLCLRRWSEKQPTFYTNKFRPHFHAQASQSTNPISSTVPIFCHAKHLGTASAARESGKNWWEDDHSVQTLVGWKAHFKFVEEDAQRSTISVPELCLLLPPLNPQVPHQQEPQYTQQTTPTQTPTATPMSTPHRVWQLHSVPVHVFGEGPHQAVLRSDWTFSDTALFRGTKCSFRILFVAHVNTQDQTGEQGLGGGVRVLANAYNQNLDGQEALSLLVSYVQLMGLPLLRVVRLQNWGWMLTLHRTHGPSLTQTSEPVTPAWEARIRSMERVIQLFVDQQAQDSEDSD